LKPELNPELKPVLKAFDKNVESQSKRFPLQGDFALGYKFCGEKKASKTCISMSTLRLDTALQPADWPAVKPSLKQVSKAWRLTLLKESVKVLYFEQE
jgi:hypothetical protein